MDNYNHLRTFFDALAKLTFWQRLFSWTPIRSLSFAAHEEFIRLGDQLRKGELEVHALTSENQLLLQERSSLKHLADESKLTVAKAEGQLAMATQRLEGDLKHVAAALKEKELLVQKFQQAHVQREKDYQDKLSRALAIQQLFEKQKSQLEEDRVQTLRAQQERLRKTWTEHENAVEKAIRVICGQHGIEYVTEFAFRGKPDNAIRVADEIIVFDAKSPAGDELGNFKSYIKAQAEAAKKYAEHEGVRKDVYLVVPTNAVEVLQNFTYELGTYRVYVITLDSLEPVILALKQIEAYDFVDQLSPEERQSICRVIGSLIYASKRRVQVDQFFNGHLLDLIAKVQRELPDALQDEIGKNEKAMKLNPPTDKRTKEISTELLSKVYQQVESQAISLQAPTPLRIEWGEAVA